MHLPSPLFLPLVLATTGTGAAGLFLVVHNQAAAPVPHPTDGPLGLTSGLGVFHVIKVVHLETADVGTAEAHHQDPTLGCPTMLCSVARLVGFRRMEVIANTREATIYAAGAPIPTLASTENIWASAWAVMSLNSPEVVQSAAEETSADFNTRVTEKRAGGRQRTPCQTQGYRRDSPLGRPGAGGPPPCPAPGPPPPRMATKGPTDTTSTPAPAGGRPCCLTTDT